MILTQNKFLYFVISSIFLFLSPIASSASIQKAEIILLDKIYGNNSTHIIQKNTLSKIDDLTITLKKCGFFEEKLIGDIKKQHFLAELTISEKKTIKIQNGKNIHTNKSIFSGFLDTKKPSEYDFTHKNYDIKLRKCF